MIEKIEAGEQLNDWKSRDIYSVRILALLKSYGCQYQFCTFYRQVIGGTITAIISKLDGNITLALSRRYDREELIRFLCLTGYTSVLSSDKFELNPRFEEGVVMSCKVKHDNTIQNIIIDEYPKLMDLFNFVDYPEQDFKAWYVDISHRVRHGTAKAYTLNVNGEIASSGILSSIYEDKAILTAVRTKDELRRMGYGSALVNAVCADIKGEVFIMRDKDRNESFYKRLGFENIGKWRMYR